MGEPMTASFICRCGCGQSELPFPDVTVTKSAGVVRFHLQTTGAEDWLSAHPDHSRLGRAILLRDDESRDGLIAEMVAGGLIVFDRRDGRWKHYGCGS